MLSSLSTTPLLCSLQVYSYHRVENSCGSPESTHTSATPTREGGGGGQLMGAPPPANLVAHPQLVRGAHFPEMECWEPSAISLEMLMEGRPSRWHRCRWKAADCWKGGGGGGGQRICTQIQPSTCTKRCPAQCIGGLVMLENQHYH